MEGWIFHPLIAQALQPYIKCPFASRTGYRLYWNADDLKMWRTITGLSKNNFQLIQHLHADYCFKSDVPLVFSRIEPPWHFVFRAHPVRKGFIREGVIPFSFVVETCCGRLQCPDAFDPKHIHPSIEGKTMWQARYDNLLKFYHNKYQGMF